mmetsp:Transcript_14104/g.20771  ORF Transcript_14104/g.20771 Transcript_14104/m.20771 type:complete len:189 (-) Transcript_14104:90-656(-)
MLLFLSQKSQSVWFWGLVFHFILGYGFMNKNLPVLYTGRLQPAIFPSRHVVHCGSCFEAKDQIGDKPVHNIKNATLAKPRYDNEDRFHLGQFKPDVSFDENGSLENVMVEALKSYKQFISPLIPPACRFLPTCSEYAIESIQTFGAGRGLILTIWRLMRCTPLGGWGYDPPQWPPPAWNAGTGGKKKK